MVKPLLDGGQYFASVFAAIGFAITAWYYGFFPGGRPPRWAGGDMLFEVPAAFVVEWIIAIVALVVFSAGRPKQEID